MKRKYQVRWYEYGLTVERSRNFFTEIGAWLFAKSISRKQHTKAIIYEKG